MRKGTGEREPMQNNRRLALLTASFSVGAALGSMLMGRDGTTAALLADGLLNPAYSTPALRMLLFDTVLLALVFSAAYARHGAVICLIALAVKGFLLSLTVTACIGALGLAGWGAAFALAFAAGFLTVAALLLLAVQAVQPAGRRVERGRSRPNKVFFLTGALCAGIMAVGELSFFYLARPLARAALSILGG